MLMLVLMVLLAFLCVLVLLLASLLMPGCHTVDTEVCRLLYSCHTADTADTVVADTVVADALVKIIICSAAASVATNTDTSSASGTVKD